MHFPAFGCQHGKMLAWVSVPVRRPLGGAQNSLQTLTRCGVVARGAYSVVDSASGVAVCMTNASGEELACMKEVVSRKRER